MNSGSDNFATHLHLGRCVLSLVLEEGRDVEMNTWWNEGMDGESLVCQDRVAWRAEVQHFAVIHEGDIGCAPWVQAADVHHGSVGCYAGDGLPGVSVLVWAVYLGLRVHVIAQNILRDLGVINHNAAAVEISEASWHLWLAFHQRRDLAFHHLLKEDFMQSIDVCDDNVMHCGFASAELLCDVQEWAV